MSSAFRLSVGANIVLLGIVAALLWRDQPPASSAEARPTRPASAPAATPRTDAAAHEGQPNITEPTLTPDTLARLEQLGISRDILVSALLEDFHRRWDKRFTELQKKYAPKQVPEREYVELARLRDAEQIRKLQAALGTAGYAAWDKQQTLRLLNSTGVPLTAEEAEQAYRLQKEFDHQHRELQMAMEDGVADMADVGTLQTQAQESFERALEKLLGKQRLNAMRGLTDPLTEVYGKFGDLNPTPSQAQAVFQAEGDFSAREAALTKRLHDTPSDAATVAAELQAMNDAREEQLRGIFGAKEYEAMKQQNDPTYKKLQQFAAAWELKELEIQSIYESLRSLHDQTDRTRSAAGMSETAGHPVDWREINSAIEQARRQTEAGLQNLIGGERLQRLKQNGMLPLR